MPSFSIIIPTFNRARWLPGAVASVLQQPVSGLEVIVVDDGSTDDTPAVAQRLAADSRVRYVAQPNQGRSAARNHGARLARGDYLGFLDSDDAYTPGALAAHQQVLAQPAAPALTLGGYDLVDEHDRFLDQRRPWDEGPLTLAGWLFNCYGMPGSMLVQRQWFERVGGFDPPCEIAEDWDWFLRSAHAGCPAAWVTASVCRYRQHAGNSIAGRQQHLQGARRALARLFAQPGLPADVRAQQPAALAWLEVVFAHRAYWAGALEEGARHLQAALDRQPAPAGHAPVALLEFLLAPPSGWQGAQEDQRAAIIAHLPTGLSATPALVRQARARVEMAQFFGGRLPRAEARARLWAAVRQDPRWLLNRGVLSFLLKPLGR